MILYVSLNARTYYRSQGFREEAHVCRPGTGKFPDLLHPYQGCGSGRIRTFLVGSGAGSGKLSPDPYPDPIGTLTMGSYINKETHIYTFSGEFFHFFR